MLQYSNTLIPLRVGHCLLICIYKHRMAAYPRGEEWKNNLRRTVERKKNRMVNGKKTEQQPLFGECNDAAGLRARPAETEA